MAPEESPRRPWLRLPRLPRPVARALVAGFALAVVAAIAWTMSRLDWSVVGVLFTRRDAGQIALLLGGSLLASTAGLSLGFLAWRVCCWSSARRSAGPRGAIFFVGFLSKYLPGRVPACSPPPGSPRSTASRSAG
ncbi:hypothetical protein [Nonomuraea rubra]|uniref:hypothetical protein n=1 Tax=Nonomuraea rubra TaxID=46180 RepID=UPI0031EDED81